MDKAKILFADNQLCTNTSIKTLVEKLKNDSNISVIFATSYQQAVSYANNKKPDFIILYDTSISGISSKPVSKLDGQNYKNNNVPLILISSKDQTRNKLIEYEELKEKVSVLEEISITDPLTGVYNRRHFDKRLLEETARANRHNLDISFLIIDIDKFKDVNDNFGHKMGDIALKRTANIILDSCRESDIVCRYGGDEFFVILPETDKGGAVFLANRILKRVANETFIFPNTKKQLTVSIGLSYKLTKTFKPPQLILEQVDTSLYKAKASGRNTLVIYSEKQNKSTL